MKMHPFFLIAWPSMLGACLLEMLVFSVVDPSHWTSELLSTQGVYSLAFFAFWAAIAFACTMTHFLIKTPIASASSAS